MFALELSSIYFLKLMRKFSADPAGKLCSIGIRTRLKILNNQRVGHIKRSFSADMFNFILVLVTQIVKAQAVLIFVN